MRDIKFSLKGKQIKRFKEDIVKIYNLMGRNYFYRSKKENVNIKFRRSIYVVKKVKRGEKFNNSNIKRIRPGYGLEPKYYEKLIGKASKKNINPGTPFKINFI